MVGVRRPVFATNGRQREATGALKPRPPTLAAAYAPQSPKNATDSAPTSRMTMVLPSRTNNHTPMATNAIAPNVIAARRICRIWRVDCEVSNAAQFKRRATIRLAVGVA